jgi:hypothetical protein
MSNNGGMSTSDAAPAADLAALREFLAERDEACPSCAYNLRGLTAARCPECDETLALRVNIAESRLGAWVATLAGVLACGGGALVCLLLVGYLSISEMGWPKGREFFPIVVYPGLVVLVEGAAALWLTRPRGRRWFRSRDRAARCGMIAAAWALLLVFTALFVVMLK